MSVVDVHPRGSQDSKGCCTTDPSFALSKFFHFSTVFGITENTRNNKIKYNSGKVKSEILELSSVHHSDNVSNPTSSMLLNESKFPFILVDKLSPYG